MLAATSPKKGAKKPRKAVAGQNEMLMPIAGKKPAKETAAKKPAGKPQRTLRLRQSTDVMTIHGSPETLDVVVRMLAGLWGGGRAPIPLQLIPLAEGRILEAGEFTVDCCRRAI
jgi:hypothetical protein